MDEGRKRVLLIAAAILAARKLCQLESTRPSPALHSIIADAVIFAERIMRRIDAEWPQKADDPHTLNRNYVLAPFHVLMSNCQNNVLLGLRLVQTLEKFLDPTSEELHFFQLSFAGPPTDLSLARQHFKNWILAKGFGDI